MMQLIEKILVATDFSPAADPVLQTAAMLAGQFQSSVCLLHVTPGSADQCSSRRPAIDRQIAGRLEAVAEGLRSRGMKVQAVLDRGDAAEQIARHAEDDDVNAIVIGAGQEAADSRFHLGPTAERLRRGTAKPVWIVKSGASPRIRRLLCPVDFSAASARALRNAVHLARQFGAELAVLTVIPMLASYSEESVGWHSHTENLPGRRPLGAWDRFLAQVDFTDVCWSATVRHGRPQREIVRAARENQADLLIMGSAGHSGLSGLFVGGVARGVAQHMPCSILTVRSEEPIRLRADRAVRMDPRACAVRSEESVCPRFRYGQELLDLGFPEQAATHFQECVAGYELCTRAWTSLVVAQRRLGRWREAEECQRRAEHVVQKRVDRQIQAEVRGQHLLYRPMFGIK